jgi:hypothetical protein
LKGAEFAPSGNLVRDKRGREKGKELAAITPGRREK